MLMVRGISVRNNESGSAAIGKILSTQLQILSVKCKVESRNSDYSTLINRDKFMVVV